MAMISITLDGRSIEIVHFRITYIICVAQDFLTEAVKAVHEVKIAKALIVSSMGFCDGNIQRPLSNVSTLTAMEHNSEGSIPSSGDSDMRPQCRRLYDCPMGRGMTQEDFFPLRSPRPMQQVQENLLDSPIECPFVFRLCSASIECPKVTKAPVCLQGRRDTFSGMIDRDS